MRLIPASFKPDTLAEARRILDLLAERFPGTVRRSSVSPLQRVYLDTFDWRIWRAGGMLTLDRAPGAAVLRWADRDGRLRRTTPVARAPRFAWDLPAGPWRKELTPLLDVRRLLPVVQLRLDDERLELLDDQCKVVARVELLDGDVIDADPGGGGGVPCRLVVHPLRGYEAIAETLRESIAALVPIRSAADDELREALDVFGREPGDRGEKFRVPLDRAMTAGQATRAILGELCRAMCESEPGLREDLDPEFLHDFRVAVRRARTCLGQLRATVPRREGRRLRRELAWLGGATGACRDLDVYLLQLGDDRAALPASARDDLVPLRDHLRSRRVQVRTELTAAIDSPRYHSLVQRWKRISVDSPVETADAADAPDASRPVGAFAAERIMRMTERVLARGSGIGDNSPDDALHALRIDCKKLRYLFEFYRALFTDRTLGRVVKRLKELQDVLGAFNDVSVQRASLERFAAELVASGIRDPGPLLTIGRLIARCDALGVERRREFAGRFGRFASKKNVRRIERMLARGSAAQATS